MKTIKHFLINVVSMMLFVFSGQSFGQLANFYSSPGYSNFIKTTLDNSIWKSSMEKYTKEYKPGSNVTKSGSSTSSAPYVIPEYRRYPAVQFKSTGTRLTMQEYLDKVEISPQEKAELKELILKIFKDYETEAAAKGYHNDWALAYVSYVGLNSHVYYGKTGGLILPFEQNEGLRDVVAEYATDNGLFNNVTDREKQQLYELMIIGGGLTYHYYEKALMENNMEDIKNLKQAAAQNLKALGINVSSDASSQAETQVERQTEKQADRKAEKFDIASFIPPQGWRRNVANGSLSFMDSNKENGVSSFCQIILYPSANSSGNTDKDFNAAWKNMVTNGIKSNAKPSVQTPQTFDGWTVVTGSANVSFEGMAYKTIVTTISGFGKTISVQVNTAGGDYAAVVDKFFNDLNLDNKANVSNNQTNMNGPITMKDYDFINPEKWQVQNNKDHITIINVKSGCVIRILSPQPSSGNLEQDVNGVFDMMYKGWQYQNNGPRQYQLSKGFLPKGLEFYRKEAAMTGYSADGRYNMEEGAAMVVKAKNQIVIISARHNSSSLGHDDCYKTYNTSVARFVNSFHVKNVPVAKPADEDAAQRIVGWWKINATGVVAAAYVFAANGNYQYGGAIGSSTTTSDMYYKYIYNRAYPFEGDGSYSISGNLLTLKKRNAAAEQVIIRFEKVNHGGLGWKDILYMLKKDVYGENESRYEKQIEQ